MALEDTYARATENRLEARKRAKTAADEIAAEKRAAADRFEGRRADRNRAARTARGRAFAAGMGANMNMASGGGFLGAAEQSAFNAVMDEIDRKEQDEDKLLGLRTGAAQSELDAATLAAEAGDEKEDFAKALSEGDADVLEAINANTNMVGSTDETAVNIALEAAIQRVSAANPRAGREMRRRYSPGGERYEQFKSSLT
tara:strand:+ start:10074 stop:10673 length:600 start_codon:yes stop_codon:yes gene_type:complete